MVGKVGFEPTKQSCFKDRRLYQFADFPLVARVGLEPTIATFRAWCLTGLGYLALEGLQGLEPWTNCLRGSRSTN